MSLPARQRQPRHRPPAAPVRPCAATAAAAPKVAGLRLPGLPRLAAAQLLQRRGLVSPAAGRHGAI